MYIIISKYMSEALKTLCPKASFISYNCTIAHNTECVPCVQGIIAAGLFFIGQPSMPLFQSTWVLKVHTVQACDKLNFSKLTDPWQDGSQVQHR